MGAAFLLVFVAPPLAFAFFGGALFPARWLAAGVGSVLVMAALLMATSSHGIIAMTPFVGFVSLIVLLPAIVAALVGAKLRAGLNKES
jgi:hypothetical protein